MNFPQPERAVGADYHELMDFLYSVFSRADKSHPRFENLYPECFDPTDESMRNHIIIRQNGKIASCVGSYHMKMDIAGCSVSIAGVGQVSTAADMLGRGFMSTLLKATVKRMEDEGASVSFLSGRRDRYSRFGWDACGCNFQTYLQGPAKDKIAAPYDFRRFPHGEFHVTDQLMELKNPSLRIIDSAETYNRRLLRKDAEVWVATEQKTDRVAGWIVVYAGSKKVVDARGPSAVITALASTAACCYSGLNIVTPGFQCGISESLRAVCQYAGCSMSMLMIVSIAKTLKEYAPFITPRIPAGFGATLEMERLDGTIETANIGPGGEKVRLDRPRMARMVFGPERATSIPGVPSSLTPLDSIFPLPFMVPGLFDV